MNKLTVFAKFFPCNWGEPLKKKKKIDPAIIKARLEKKKKKILKEIRKLERLDRPLKPIAELEKPACLIDEYETRKRIVVVPPEKAEERIVLLKQWSKYKTQESKSDGKVISRLMKLQQKALDELRLESEELYQAAVKIDTNLIPMKFTGPKETPPKEDYPYPDGAFNDVSKKWI